jgi:L-aminoadipate-semialdehyde dehydrogenase
LLICFAAVFVPLSRMPLNPNGKIDKPALPFPDTAQAASVALRSAETSSFIVKGAPTEEAMRAIWEGILPNAPSPIPLNENFFDLGGHSILATRLIFEIRKVFVVNAPLGLVFDKPTIVELAAAIEALRNSDLGLTYNDANLLQPTSSSQPPASNGCIPKNPAVAPIEYSQDYVNLLPRLRESYSVLPLDFTGRPLTIFLTGATGFLGAFLLRDLLSRQKEIKKVICLVRTSDPEQGIGRLREGSIIRGVWDEEWIASQRLEVIIGDLGHKLFGMGHDQWARVAKEADVVLHNGALVCDLFCGRMPKPCLKIGCYRFTGYIRTKSFGPPTSSRR